MGTSGSQGSPKQGAPGHPVIEAEVVKHLQQHVLVLPGSVCIRLLLDPLQAALSLSLMPPEKMLWSMYLTGIAIGFATWPQVVGSFGP